MAESVVPAILFQDTADSAVGEPGLDTVIATEGMPALLRAAAILVIGLPVVIFLSRTLGGWLTKRYSPQQGMVGRKLAFYAGLAVVLVWFLGELGFSLAPLLGAAGIVGIALGFASQTSVSNIISGFFLMAEQPFRVDDVIQVGGTGGTIGRVLSIDMMSVKLRTFDNRFVRIPNESIIKTEVTNITRFPIRRADIPVGVAYKEEVDRVREVLLDVADRNPLCLTEPEPTVRFEAFGASSVDLTLAVWAAKENFLALKNSIQEEVKARFDEEGIEIPFPHQTLYTGAESRPFPVRIVEDGPADGGAPD